MHFSMQSILIIATTTTSNKVWKRSLGWRSLLVLFYIPTSSSTSTPGNCWDVTRILSFLEFYWNGIISAQRLRIHMQMQEMWIPSLGQEGPLEKEVTTHSSTLAWNIPWIEEPGGLQSVGSQRVGRGWETEQTHTYSTQAFVLDFISHNIFKIYWFPLCYWVIFMGLPGGNHGRGPACQSRLDVRNAGSVPGSGRSPGGGNGYTFQYSCLENPIDSGAWWAAVHGVTKSWTRLKQLRTYAYSVYGMDTAFFFNLFTNWVAIWIACSLGPL